MNARALALLTLLLAGAHVFAAGGNLLTGARRVLFLGDSITYAGHYVALIDTRLRQAGVAPLPELINLGLPSETCSGLSEPDHPFPRPNVQERLERALEKTRPDLVFACYGMNDGIYYPFGEERFAAYQRGINRIIEKVRATGARLVLLAPPPFDPLPLRKQGKLLPATAPEFSYKVIYADYDDVLTRYGKWVLAQKDRVDAVVDLHQPVLDYVNLKRKTRPDFTLSGDGVHANQEGHAIMADAICRALGVPLTEPDPALLKLVTQKHQLMTLAWLTHVGHLRPGPNSKLTLAEARVKEAGLERQIAAARPGDWSASVPFPKTEKPVTLFNGTDLTGWSGLTEKFWSVESGVIKGANDGVVPASTYLFTARSYRNFRLVFEVRQTPGAKFSTMHSAIGVLGERIRDNGGDYGFKGPLLMFCHDWGIWDANRRNRVYPDQHKGQFRHPSEVKGDWNRIEVLVIGNRIRFVNNGQLVIDFTDRPELLKPSPIGLQLHSNAKPQEYRFRGLRLAESPADRLVTLAE